MIIERPATILSSKDVQVKTPGDMVNVVRNFYENIKDKEHFSVFALNGDNHIISERVVSVGIINKTVIHPREVFRHAILDNARAIIISHNHPSGNPKPSDDDIITTETLLEASKIIGIELLDHIIIGGDTYFSFLEHNIIFEED